MSKYASKAAELFNQGYNCAQSVTAAFAEKMGMEFTAALKLSSSFGAGMGRLREVCGALTGAFIVMGCLYGNIDITDKAKKTEQYELVQSFAFKFKEKFGSIICRELLNLDGYDNPVPSERTEKYYLERPCAQFVFAAAEILEQVIKEKEDADNENSSGV